jgi:hypothetical protein
MSRAIHCAAFCFKSAVWYPSDMTFDVFADRGSVAAHAAVAMFLIAARARFIWAGSLFYA